METKISFWKYKGPLERVKTKILTKLIIRQSENQKKIIQKKKLQKVRKREWIIDFKVIQMEYVHTFTKH